METLQPHLDAQHMSELQAIGNQVLAEQQAADIARVHAAAPTATIYRSTVEGGLEAVRIEVTLGEARAASERVLGEHVGAAVLPAANYVNPEAQGSIAAKVELHHQALQQAHIQEKLDADEKAKKASKRKRDLGLAA